MMMTLGEKIRDQDVCEEDDGGVEDGGDDADDGTSSAEDSDCSGTVAAALRQDNKHGNFIGVSAKVQPCTAASFEPIDLLITYFLEGVADRPPMMCSSWVSCRIICVICALVPILCRNDLGHRGFDAGGFDDAAGLATIRSFTVNLQLDGCCRRYVGVSLLSDALVCFILLRLPG